MDKKHLNEIIDKIREKEELRHVSYEVIEDLLKKYIAQNSIKLEQISLKDKDLIKKEIRAELRKKVGRFHQYEKKIEEYVRDEDFSMLIKTHISTKERLEFYPEIEKLIAEINPKVILDLGCGINPIAIAEEETEYYAIDINEEDLQVVRRYFEVKKINGKALNKDIRKIHEIALPKADLCLIFKVLDLVDKKGHKVSEEILDQIEAEYFLISFSTKTLSGRPMNHPQRGWIERLFQRKKWPYRLIKSRNEIFYLAKKSCKN